MKLRIILSILALFGTTVSKQSTTLTFYAEYEEEQQEDFIELSLSVKAQGSSLVDTMGEASNIAEQIKAIATQFCQAHTSKKAECKDIVDTGKYNINPNYQKLKRQSKFMGFQVEHKVNIKVLAVDHISDLADTILKQPNTKIVSFEWKPLQEVNSDEAAVKQGTAQGQQLCDQIGMQFNKINNVSEVTQSQADQVAVYKFEIECFAGRKPSKTKDNENEKRSKSTKDKSQKDKSENDKQNKGDKKQKIQGKNVKIQNKSKNKDKRQASQIKEDDL